MNTITASSTVGISLSSPSYTNPVVIDPGITIAGPVNAVSASSGYWTLQNHGTLTGNINFGYGIYLADGGIVTNASGGLLNAGGAGVFLAGAGTVTNAGSMTGRSGVHLGTGGALTNQSGGSITGTYYGLLAQNAPTYVDNAGYMAGAQDGGIRANAALTVTNRSGGTISGGYGINVFFGSAGTVTNAGAITGTSGAGMYLDGGGIVTNSAGGSIAGTIGIQIASAAGTLIDAGTISGSSTAVLLPSNYSDLLVLYPSAVFYGTVSGGNVPFSSIPSTLELKSAASAGTLTAAGSAFIDFKDITVDASAVWTIASGSLSNGYTLVNNGTLTNAATLRGGVTLGANALLNNVAGATISGNTGVGGGPGTVLNAGLVAATGFINFGISLPNGAVTNLATGTITGAYGVGIGSASDTLVNYGHISASLGAAVVLPAGGGFTNQSGATVSGFNAVTIDGGPGTVLNDGVISASFGYGVTMSAGGSVTNQAGGSIVTGGQYGVGIAGGAGTVINAGLIDPASNSQAIRLLAGGYVNNTGTIIGAGTGIFSAGTATIENSGSINSYHGIYLTNGAITNSAGGIIQGSTGGVLMHGAGMLLNSGSIGGTGAFGVSLAAGGSIVDNPNGTISGSTYGIKITGGGATVAAFGSISGGVDAIKFAAGYYNTLAVYPGASFSGIVDGSDGLGEEVKSLLLVTRLLAGDTDLDVVAGLGTEIRGFDNIQFQSGVQAQLVGSNTIAAGAVATVQPTATISSSGTLAVAGPLGTSSPAGTIKANGALVNANVVINNGLISLSPATLVAATLTGTGTVQVGANSTAEVQTTFAGGIFAFASAATGGYVHFYMPVDVTGMVTNFAPGDTIDLKGVTAASVGFAGGVLSFPGGSFPLGLASPGTVVATPSGDGAAVTVTCFRDDTLITTPSGDRRVQDLIIGDNVLTLRGARRINWIGHRHIDCRRHPSPDKVWPVRIPAGTFGDGLPSRDLWLSPDHAIFIDGVLVPAKHLIDGEAIVQVQLSEVTYFHIELAEHAILFAEDLPVESYLDSGDRMNFANGDAPIRLHADFSSREWEARGCAPLVVSGPRLDAIRGRIATPLSPSAIHIGRR
jgi:Hint domain